VILTRILTADNTDQVCLGRAFLSSSTYDQTVFSLAGDDDLHGSPGDQWRYYLVSGVSSNLTASESVQTSGPFRLSEAYTGFTIAETMHDQTSGKWKAMCSCRD
jgi:hypothetical protein